MWNTAFLGVVHPDVQYVFDEVHHRDQGAFAVVGGIHDPDQRAAQRYATAEGVPTYISAAELLVQASVAVVDRLYLDRGQVVIDTLNAGAHLPADKPICTALDGLAEIEQTTLATGKAVNLMLEKRGYPRAVAAQQLVEWRELGDVVGSISTSPHGMKYADRSVGFLNVKNYGGIGNDLTMHDLDGALFCGAISAAQTGPPPGHGSTVVYGSVTLVIPGAIVTSEVSWLTPAAAELHGDYRMCLTGTNGSAETFWAGSGSTRVFHEVPLSRWTVPHRRSTAGFRDQQPAPCGHGLSSTLPAWRCGPNSPRGQGGMEQPW